MLPEILRKSITEVMWTARKKEQGIEDKFDFATNTEIANVLKETVRAGGRSFEGADFVPADVVSATRYDLTDPQIAWRSILLTAQKQTDGVSGAVIGAVADSLFETYGVDVPEEFLGSIGGQILTLRFDPEGEDVVVVADAKDVGRLKKSLAKEFKLNVAPEKVSGAELWRSDEGEMAFAVVGDRVLLGHGESVVRCLDSLGATSQLLNDLKAPASAVSLTIATDTDPNAALVAVLGQRVDDKTSLTQRFRVSTSFNGNGIQRTEVSQFGMIGSIIEQFGKEQ